MSITTESIESTSIDGIIEHFPDTNNSIGSPNEEIAKIVSAFECRKCSFVHKSYKALLEHYKSHETQKSTGEEEDYEEEVILVCILCYAQYKTEEDLKTHLIDIHGYIRKSENGSNKVTENTLETPGEKDESDDSKEDDQTEEIPPVPFRELKAILKSPLIHKCPIKGCFFKFESKEKLESHIKCHVSTDAGRVQEFKCINCNLEMKNWRNCTLHMWKSHQINIDMLKCPVCIYKAITAAKIWSHLKVHKKWRPKILKATKRHPIKEWKDSEPTRWYSQKTCEVCGRKFANSKTLSKHVKVVHNKIKPFICNVCGRKSARKATWIIHMRQHTGDKPLSCKICPFRASDPSVLKKHELRHKKIPQYSCNSCEYKTIQSSSLKMHMKAFHPDEYMNLCCDQCTYVSVSAKYLEAHKKDHKKGLILNEDSSDITGVTPLKIFAKTQCPEKSLTNVEISSDCFLPLESTDSIAHDPSIDTGGVTIPAHSEDTQFPS